MSEYGPQTPLGQQLFLEKYAQPGESPRDAYNRVASALVGNNSEHYHAFRNIIGKQFFLPAGRIMAGAGASRQVTLYNCFVSGIISDSFVDGYGSIMDRAKEAAQTMRMGGGIGYDFSTLRPRGSLIKKLGSTASGPVSFMHIFNAVCLATCSAGHRRGAQMGILRVDHPDIMEFIHAKTKLGALEGFNLSVAVTDSFMEAVEQDTEFPLKFEDQIYQTLKARELWEAIMRSAWDWGEPGIIFIDRINNENNLGYCEKISATNPCSEQPLPPYGACLLGSFNLTKYVQWNEDRKHYNLNIEPLLEQIPLIVRSMDRVVDISRYPLEAQRLEAQSKRRMGLGVTGLANAIEALGINRNEDYSYGSTNFLAKAHEIFYQLANSAYQASAKLAGELGSFPAFEPDWFLERPYVEEALNVETRKLIQTHGLRNSHLISMAPTGTISLVAGNVSSGIEPTYSVEVDRLIHFPDGVKTVTIKDYGVENFGTRPKIANQVSAKEHINVLVAAQRWCDSAVSKTCNVDGTMLWEDFKNIYIRAYRMGAKSCSVFNSDGKRSGAIRAISADTSNCATGTCDV